MRVFSTVAVGVLVFATPCLSGAQATSAAGDGHATQSTANMQTLIKALSGHWSLKLKFEPSGEAPTGMESTGEATWRAGPEGLTFSDEEVFSAGPQTVVVVGILWQDMKTKAFHAMDCSNQMSHTCDLEGAVDDVTVRWTGTELIIDEKEVSSQGKVMTSRAVWSDITPNSFTESGYLGAPGGPFQKVMTALATRAGDK